MTYRLRHVSATMALFISASQGPAAPSLLCTSVLRAVLSAACINVAVQAKASLASPGQHREGCCPWHPSPIKTSMVLHTSVIPEGDPRDGLMIPLCTGIHALLFFAGGVYLHSFCYLPEQGVFSIYSCHFHSKSG